MQKPIVLSDETFHQTFFSSYKSYVVIDKFYVNVAHLDTVRKKFVYFSSQRSDDEIDAQKLSSIFDQHFVTEHQQQVNFYIVTPQVHIFPESFFKEECAQQIFDFANGNELHKQMVSQKALYNTILQFNVPEIWTKAFKFSNCNFFHHAHLLLHLSEWMIRKYKYKSAVFLHFHDYLFEVVVIQNNQLTLFNTYHFQHTDDVLYYVHWMIKSIELDIKQNIFVLSGWVDKKGELIKKMKEFDFRIEWAKFNPQYIYSYRFNELQTHQFATLFCV